MAEIDTTKPVATISMTLAASTDGQPIIIVEGVRENPNSADEALNSEECFALLCRGMMTVHLMKANENRAKVPAIQVATAAMLPPGSIN